MAKHLIYQFWNGGTAPQGALAGQANMQAYARLVGADYRFIENGNFALRFVKDPRFYDDMRPVYDESFYGYDRVLYVDMDVFATERLLAAGTNIFEEPCAGFGICEEPGQPALREHSTKEISGTNDNRWAKMVKTFWGVEAPRDNSGRVRVFNSGVIMFTPEAMAPSKWVPIPDYFAAATRARLPSFYTHDQPYLHMMAFSGRVPFTLLPQEWNRQVHRTYAGGVYDERNADTRFVHVQIRGKKQWDAETLRRVVNLPQSEWGLPA